MDSPEEEPPTSQSSYLVGFIIANIVGIQYYRGTISGREMVALVREPLNPFDENAIKVLNTRTIQLGHIERNVAKVLAPLVDSELVTIVGIVPKTRSTGNKFRIPCQIHVFAKVDDFGVVKERILGGGLAFVSETDAGFGMSEAVVVKERNAGKRVKSLDEIFKGVKRTGIVVAVDAPGEVVVSELLVHQKEALGWLLRRENSGELPPFWEEVEEKEGGGFVNVLTNFRSDKRPEALRGGIFADDMGLGKTLVLLSLIAFDRFGDLSVVRRVVEGSCGDVEGVDEEVSASGGKKGKRGRGKRKDEGGRKRRKIKGDGVGTSDMKGKSVSFFDDGDFCGEGHKMTLIVCPPVVFSTWVTQILEHTKRGSFKMYMYYGDRTRDVEELKKYDIVLTTYSTLAAEESWVEPPMRKIEWWRVILDEAHVIKNANAQQSQAVTNLNAKRRWVVTGTPIQNGSFDLFSLMAFLRFEPFSIKSYWQSLVQRPLAQGNKKGLSLLQILMATISLRRTKDIGLIGLPPKSIETFYVELSREERELYDHMEGEAKNIVRNYMNSESFMRNYSTILSVILRLRQICTDMALCPSELKSVLPSYNIEDVSNNPELLKKVAEVLQDGEDFDCPICISPPTDLVITCCAHIFCRACILKTMQRTKACCPLCRRPLSQSDLFSAPPESSDIDKDSAPSTKVSSKVSALLKFLVASRDENPLRKSVVFSQFRKMLVLLEAPLKAAGFKILRLDGSMNAKKRAQVIQDFGVPAPDGPTVLLASLKASGAGINLTAASRVYLLEPWWNPAVEEQAMDRVHRIGQKEDVKIVRLIARNSIEERILELQERKKQLAREAFGRRGPKESREVNMDDIRVLMSL